jgi:hypothetical protein
MNDDRDDGARSDLGSLFLRVSQIAHALPGAQFAQRQIERVETRVLSELKERMERIEPPAPQRPAKVTGIGDRPSGPSLPERMAVLLERAAEQTHEQATEALFRRIIVELVPDEARILGALSDGTTYPMLHVGIGTRVGPVTRRIIENVSNIGKPAGVKLLEQVPAYITHLRTLALLESAPEDKDFEIRYQILESDLSIKQAIERAQPGAISSVRYLRRTLRLSEFGRQFWLACAAQE